jgi:tripartite ATP-independent transporter DctM subunit
MICFIVLIFGGVPISFSLGLASIITLLYGNIDLIIFAQYMFTSLFSFPLLAIPLFICLGSLMEVTDITSDLIKTMDLVFGRIRGRLGYMNVGTSMVFAGMSGSAVADTAGVGSILIPAMKKDGYTPEFSVGLTAASSVIGSIIPPSIFMVVYGAVAQVSIGALFLGGALPGIIVGLSQLVVVYFYIRNHPEVGKTSALHKTASKASLARFILPAFIPIIIVGGILGGIFTATEAAAVSVVYLFLLFATVYRRVATLKNLIRGLINSAKLLGAIMFCVSTGRIFGWILAYYDLPDYVATYLNDTQMGPMSFMILTALFFLLIGTFESGIAAIIIFVPIIAPISVAVGVNPIQLGVITTMCIAVGLITPPYGLCLFLASNIGKITVTKAFRASFIFLGLFVVIIGLCILVPEIILAVPKMVFPQFAM